MYNTIYLLVVFIVLLQMQVLGFIPNGGHAGITYPILCPSHFQHHKLCIINPRRVCERVTVVCLSVCVSVRLSVQDLALHFKFI